MINELRRNVPAIIISFSDDTWWINRTQYVLPVVLITPTTLVHGIIEQRQGINKSILVIIGRLTDNLYRFYRLKYCEHKRDFDFDQNKADWFNFATCFATI